MGLDYLAKRFCEVVHETPYSYTPLKFKHHATDGFVTGWPKRFLAYRWGRDPNPFSDDALLDQLAQRIRPAVLDVLEGRTWDRSKETNVRSVVEELFSWGGVARGHIPVDLVAARSVLCQALGKETDGAAPMDSAWTKLAALASFAGASTSADIRQQIIFDSRVSVSLLRNIDQCVLLDPEMMEIKKELISSGLGYVPGRGGTRPANIKKLAATGWKNSYKSWRAHFVASSLVAEIVAALNQSGRFGWMPSVDQVGRQWSYRGVEKVLFMDGY